MYTYLAASCWPSCSALEAALRTVNVPTTLAACPAPAIIKRTSLPPIASWCLPWPTAHPSGPPLQGAHVHLDRVERFITEVGKAEEQIFARRMRMLQRQKVSGGARTGGAGGGERVGV